VDRGTLVSVADQASTMRPAPGRHRLPKEFVVRHQRARIIAALTEETVAQGYRAVTVADIVRRAGIARNTFYENFTSKDDCFLAASEFAAEQARRQVLDAAAGAEDWPSQVNAGLAAFLRCVVGEPALAHTCLVEALAAGPAAAERYERSIQAFVPFFRQGRRVSPHGEQLPDTLEETVVGGLFWILYQRLASGAAAQLEQLRPELAVFALTPYIGAGAAKDIAATRPATPS
jgi:AcrR family transcriptional regulator